MKRQLKSSVIQCSLDFDTTLRINFEKCDAKCNDQ